MTYRQSKRSGQVTEKPERYKIIHEPADILEERLNAIEGYRPILMSSCTTLNGDLRVTVILERGR